MPLIWARRRGPEPLQLVNIVNRWPSTTVWSPWTSTKIGKAALDFWIWTWMSLLRLRGDDDDADGGVADLEPGLSGGGAGGTGLPQALWLRRRR